MKTKKVICVAALIVAAVAASSWLGSQYRRSSTSRTLNEVGPLPRTNDTAWEYKTVESTKQQNQQMQEFQTEGWLILSISEPLPQTDGTIRRKYKLKRTR
jgi:hypothetical protein